MAVVLSAATAPVALAGTYTPHELTAPAQGVGASANPPQPVLGQNPLPGFHINVVALAVILGVLFLLERRRIRLRR